MWTQVQPIMLIASSRILGGHDTWSHLLDRSIWRDLTLSYILNNGKPSRSSEQYYLLTYSSAKKQASVTTASHLSRREKKINKTITCFITKQRCKISHTINKSECNKYTTVNSFYIELSTNKIQNILIVGNGKPLLQSTKKNTILDKTISFSSPMASKNSL